jgi:dipeptidyl aminopeptidase/acylaminoacyl peptidase
LPSKELILKKMVIALIMGYVFMNLFCTETGYKLPAEDMIRIYNTPAFPFISFVPFDEIGLEMTYQTHQTLEQLADPREELAGEVFSKKLNAPMRHYPRTSLKIHHFKTGKVIPVDLPQNIKIRDYKISYDNKKVALSYETENGIKLIAVDIDNGNFKEFIEVMVNDVLDDSGFWWMNDGETLLVKTIPKERKEIPEKPIIPESPMIDETVGKFSTNPTYQYLLKNDYDKKLFDFYFTSQLILLNTGNGKSKKIGEPAVFDDIDPSPDNDYILVERIEKPYSCEVPYYRFPKSIEVWDVKENLIKVLYKRPLQDEIPIGGTYKGPRYFQWQSLKKATLVWIEALDEGNPKNKVEFRDKIKQLNAPFDGEAREIFKTEHRFSYVIWSEDEDELIYSEYDRDHLWRKTWLYTIGDSTAELLLDQSVNDRYNYPGKIVKRTTEYGELVFVKNSDFVYFNNTSGATPEGNYPNLSKFNLKTKENEILFKCLEGHYEKVYNFVGKDFKKIVIGSETPATPRNYFFVDLETGERERITDHQNPYPEITELKKELITYSREDSILLSGTLYLPRGYRQGERLPLILNAYPDEYTDASTAGQVRSSPNRFISFRGASVKYLALQGYAVLANASIPVIGDPETVNETYIEQLLKSVEAAIDFLDDKKIIDSQRVGVIGHSYGAFMVANILAHSDLCCAGVAKSGAYNRTLTPFGFQSERRILWQAKDFYVEISPFMNADKINEPLLLIHGENDPISGTFPMQSRRMYQALKGQGATAKLVVLPYEGHGYYAKESNLHVLAEIIEWFDKYVKNKNSE